MLEYSDESRRLVSTFLTYRNDVDIYTEDEEKDKEFYRTLFSRLIKSDIRINDVTPLGNRDQVITRCKSEPKGDRKKVFIVDGDIAVVNGVSLNIENLFVLDRYCIENFLIDNNSACNYVYLNCGTKSKEKIEADIKYQEWLSQYSESLINLFIHFAIINFYGGKFALFNANKYHTKTKESYIFDNNLVQADIDTLRNEAINSFGETNYLNKLNELKEKWKSDVDTLLTIVSGKDYLIPILLIKTQEFKSSKAMPTLEEVKINLVQHFDVTKLAKLKDFIESDLPKQV